MLNFLPPNCTNRRNASTMQTALFRIKEYLKFLARSKNVHRIHSPFIFHLLHNIILKRDVFTVELAALKKIAALHESNSTRITPAGIGALNNPTTQTFGTIARRTAQSQFWREALYKIAADLKPDVILELGTGSGITALYLAEGSKKSLITIEGDTVIFNMAKALLADQNPQITCINGMFDDVLPDLLSDLSGKILAYVDGNHTYDATKRYFEMLKPILNEEAIVILDDIYWSPDMLKAWNEIKQDAFVQQSIDFYRLGMLFFRKHQAREHFTLRTSTFGLPTR
jgi:predicted O-methyltransferase YrrM